MRLSLIFSAMMVLICMGCSGTSAPTTPKDTTADLPSWNISFEGQVYNVGPADLLGERQLADPVEPGTDMTADELRVYFSWNITMDVFPDPHWCVIYSFYMLPTLQGMPDATMFQWVVMMEGQGYDVPNGPPPTPPC